MKFTKEELHILSWALIRSIKVLKEEENEDSSIIKAQEKLYNRIQIKIFYNK